MSQNFPALRFMLTSLIVVSLGQLIVASFLVPRQSGPISVPPACNSSCSELNTILTSCQNSASCLCTQLLINDFGSCFLCVGQLNNANFDTPQQTINQLVSECQQIGVTLTPVILPGEPSTQIPPPANTPPPSQGGSSAPQGSPAKSTSTPGASAPPAGSSPASQKSSNTTPNAIQTIPSILPTPTAPSSSSGSTSASTGSNTNNPSQSSNTSPTSSPDTNNTSSGNRILPAIPSGIMAFIGIFFTLL